MRTRPIHFSSYTNWLVGPLFFLVWVDLHAQEFEGRKEIQAHPISGVEHIILDGKIDEPFWLDIPPSGDFLMQEPNEGGKPTERTEIRIGFDRENLYIGVILWDSDPAGIKAFQKKRDAEIETDDRFRWILDTFLDQRNAYFFEINPAALWRDGLISTGQGTTLNTNWDGIWRVWTHIGDFGWSAEIKIPFRTLNFDPDIDQWGINFQRTIRRKNEELLWTGHRRNQGILRPQNAGLLTHLSDISQGLGLEVIPYGIVQNKKVNEENGFETSTKVDGGFDLNYNITPSLKASFTLNTDFAETEVDERQINLTRFPLLFPEKRDFFLEGAGIYEFAPLSGQRPYFSRKIGLVEGVPIPITYGIRLLGNIGAFKMALLQVRTGKKDSLNPEDFSVARVVKNIWKESSLGVTYTRRSTKDGEDLAVPLQDRHTIGADLGLNTSNFRGDKNFQFQAFFVYHNSPFPEEDTTGFWDRSSRGIRFNFPNQPWSAHVSYREFGLEFDPAVGFHRRNAFRRLQPQIAFSPLFEKSDVIREVSWGIRFEHLMDLDLELLTQQLRFSLGEIRFETGDRIEFDVRRNFERLQEDFDIKRDGTIIIPVDEYVTWSTEIEIETASYRRISGSFEIETGEFWSGNQTRYQVGLTLRPLSGINLSTEYIYTKVDLKEGKFNTNLVRFNGSFDFTPSISFTTNIQFDNLSELLGINNRFRWIVTPGSDIFLVYNHNWLNEPNELVTLERIATLKITYTHRF
ncbi:MAG: DUF5916 domain-containing protein [Bacteroidetes bacterium]|nr:DUF5916 domain-containing protein [Bacteroidota bacterium]